MINAIDPKTTKKQALRCTECDREMDHYNTFLNAGNEMKVVCWECQSRDEKGFNTKRDFGRGARSGYIPR